MAKGFESNKPVLAAHIASRIKQGGNWSGFFEDSFVIALVGGVGVVGAEFFFWG
jgi:hypothetical protein